jgi:hypothetical protein
MGQEISLTQFEEGDFQSFHRKLEQETLLLNRLIEQKACSLRNPVAGFEIEAWLINHAMRPSPINNSSLPLLMIPWPRLN